MRRTLWVAGPEIRFATRRPSTCTASSTGCRDRPGRAGSPIPTSDRGGRATVLATLADGPAARDLGVLPELALPVMIGTGRQATSVAAHTRLLLVLGFAGDVVRARPTGTWINGQYRWAAADGWIPGGIDAGLDKRTAAVVLARLWLRSFGPATRADLQWWPAGRRRRRPRARRCQGRRRQLDDGPGFLLPTTSSRRRPSRGRALPGLGRRRWGGSSGRGTSARRRRSRVRPQRQRGPTVWVDGRIVGSWVQRRDGRSRCGCSPTSRGPARRDRPRGRGVAGPARRRAVQRPVSRRCRPHAGVAPAFWPGRGWYAYGRADDSEG